MFTRNLINRNNRTFIAAFVMFKFILYLVLYKKLYKIIITQGNKNYFAKDILYIIKMYIIKINIDYHQFIYIHFCRLMKIYVAFFKYTL